MEMTNYCNLQCKNCGTPTAKCKKGFIEDSTVLATLSWVRKGQTLNYHRVGEPLLHKNLVKYVRWGVEAGIKPVISTNGLLLTEEKLVQLYSAGLRHLVITLHKEQSWQAFQMCCEYFEKHNIQVLNFKERHSNSGEDIMYFQGKILDFPGSESILAKYADILENFSSLFEKIPVHTWAGNVPGTRQDFSDEVVAEHQKNCYFIQQRVVNVRWDGTVVGCCFDIENENVLGNIHEYTQLEQNMEKYQLCRHCDNNWAVS